jgi:3-methylcrotonyl-CoA carboxylase alpha subunit
MSISRLLIANRGEIAVRIMKTAGRLGIETVAVYSTADTHAMHVKTATRAHWIGEAPALESYLNIGRILQAAVDSNADAIHPGYGFLAENPDFADRCSKAGITFVGPPVGAIRSMGLKGVAKAMMLAAGVPVLPGVNEVNEDTIKTELESVGYPVLVKPEAGGGGKGMKIVRKPGQLGEAIQSAKREALSAFGNDTLMVEKYLDHPRHIEIQIFADRYGNCIHLNERDCSLQRRHQKILEEAPAPNLSNNLRRQMGVAAVNAAIAISYVGAGTVEFLLDEDGKFYFMEMNTRLQVEHPVTELITGQDLVEWQLNIAAGESLPISQEDVTIDGHAIECRIYAEDPLNEFLPASGKIEYLQLPADVRVDSGILTGDVIGVHYDPLLMKIIAWSHSRDESARELARALASLEIAGVRTNRDFLTHLLRNRTYLDGKVSTDFLDNEQDFPQPSQLDIHNALAAAATYLLEKHQHQSPWLSETSFRLNQENASDLILSVGEDEYTVSTTITDNTVTVHTRFGVTTHGSDYTRNVFQLRNQLTVFLPERTLVVQLPDVESQHASETEKTVKAPMSGKLISVLISAGTEVEAGTPLVVIEAMKMEHTVCAPEDGKVEEIYFSLDDPVEEGAEILDFRPRSQDLALEKS